MADVELTARPFETKHRVSGGTPRLREYIENTSFIGVPFFTSKDTISPVALRRARTRTTAADSDRSSSVSLLLDVRGDIRDHELPARLRAHPQEHGRKHLTRPVRSLPYYVTLAVRKEGFSNS